MEWNASSLINPILTPTLLPINTTTDKNVTIKQFSVFDGCDQQREAIIFDLTLQSINVVVGIPANILVIAILISNRKDTSTSDIYLGCLAFLDIYFGVMTPFSFVNLYYWHSKDVWSALKFSYGVKDTSGPLFFSCICLDRFVAVLFPVLFGQLKHMKCRLSLSVLVTSLTM